MSKISSIVPVIISGGSGSRLWPLSRAGRPKQFLPLVEGRSLFELCAKRVDNEALFAEPVVISNNDHRFMVLQQLASQEMQPSAIYLEPEGRNTAPALAMASLLADPDDVLLFLPSDQLINDQSAFYAAIEKAQKAVDQGRICLFGMQPDYPATGYGYIEGGEAIVDGVLSVQGFREKPPVDAAQAMIEQGGFFWNGGIFMARASVMIAEFEKHAPDILEGVRAAGEGIESDLQFQRFNAEKFGEIRAESIDYAVIEKSDNLAVVPVEMGWSDLGSLGSLADLADKDADANQAVGDAMFVDAKGNYVHGQDRLIALAGVQDLIVVDTTDSVLVLDRKNDQLVKKLVTRLKDQDRPEHKLHNKVYRPWGTYRSIANGNGYQAKEIEVYPGKRLSLQWHHHRAEHWVIVCGTAIVTLDGVDTELTANQSIYIPKKAHHRLENKTDERLVLIEVQSGSYLGEDDIVRIEDDFKRSSSD